MTRIKVREVFKIMEETQQEEPGASGFASDGAALEWARDLDALSVSAWLMWKRGEQHPPLVRSIHVVGLSPETERAHTHDWYPMAEAALQWANIAAPPVLPVHRYDTATGRAIRRRTGRLGLDLQPLPGSVRRWYPPGTTV